MTREEHLKYCTICLNRKMSRDKGLVCSITDEQADFEGTCPDFKEDADEKARKLNLDLSAAGHHGASKSLEYKKNKENGAILFLLGAAVLIFTLYNFSSYGILLVPFGLIIYGARTYNKGVEQEKAIEKQEAFEKDKDGH